MALAFFFGRLIAILSLYQRSENVTLSLNTVDEASKGFQCLEYSNVFLIEDLLSHFREVQRIPIP